MRRLPLVVVVIALAAAVGITAVATGGRPFASPGSSSGASPSSPIIAGEPSGSAPLATAGGSTPIPGGSASEPPVDAPLADVPIVPVAQFRTTVRSVTRADFVATVEGRSARWDALELVESEAPAILAALRVEIPAGSSDLVLVKDATTLSRDLAAHRKRLGVLRADVVRPSVRALAWGGHQLFGVDAVDSVAAWGLTARLPQPVDTPIFDPSASWTLVAGGDIMLDRGVAQTLTLKGKGADFAFDGGTAEITGTCKDCSPLGWDTPYTRRTGNGGAVRHLIESADIAIANFENPAPDAYRYHTSGTVFSANPKLIAGLANAGIDWVGLANNHIRDAGGPGILQTIANLKKYGIRSSGAGKDLKAARTPAILEAGGVKVAFLAYDTIAKAYGAGADRVGSAQMSAPALRADVAAARKAGAGVVIVFPHWGTEYDPTPFGGQQALARAAIDAGADMVIGNHAHWAGAVEVYKGRPIWYALGNFVFDQTWSIPTMEGITLELTFRGKTLVQARMRPHIILDKAQPNFLDPAGSGRFVMGQVFDASKGLPW
ncbi:MAG TPA: CapA family protein [Candidatus Limnocylindrales bacterium]|nr:CapA family protein [Candidatus Limnocylindrales bacterium]